MSSTNAPVPITALLAHREWVRRLARSLVNDDASADDVVQRTWIAALRSPPSSERGVRAWLARVVRTQAFDARRASGRREAHERASARHESTRSAAEVVAEAETQRRVVSAVCGLDEPYRSTILLRFFEDLPPRRIAKRMGVPVETVRTRQRRAAELLRRELGGTDGSEWLAGLAPLLAAPKGTSPAMWAAGGTAMKVSTKAVIAATFLLAAAGALTFVAASREADETPATESADVGSAGGAKPRRPEPRTSVSRRRDTQAGAATATPARTPAPLSREQQSEKAHAETAVLVTSAPRPSGPGAPPPHPTTPEELLELLAKQASPPIPRNELADDAAALAPSFRRRREGPVIDPLGPRPQGRIEDGSTIRFPAGCHVWDTSALAPNSVFPQDLVVEGAGMDETLVVPTRTLDVRGRVAGLTFRNLTFHCDNAAMLSVQSAIVRLDHVRVIGFEGRRSRTGDQIVCGQSVAFLAEDCRFEGGFGAEASAMWLLGTSPGTTPQDGWLTIGRFDRCTFVGLSKSYWLGDQSFSIYLPSPPAAVVYSHCDLVAATSSDRAFIEHPEVIPRAWMARTYARFEDCRVSYSTEPPPSERKVRDVAEINPAWKWPKPLVK